MDHYDIVEHAQIVPPMRGSAGAGVCRADGSFLQVSTIWRGDQALFEPAEPRPAPQKRAGTYLYGGSFSWHFGHFLVETLSRLWPLTDANLHVEAILFFPRRATRDDHTLEPYQRALLGILAPDIPVEIVAEPTEVERLVVPDQGFGIGPLEAGTPAFRSFIQSRAWPAPAADGAKRLYVSRARLRQRRGHILGDDRLADFLADQGYTVFHPQEHSLEAQIAAYRAADRLIFDDGSAVHLYGFIAREEQTVALLERRIAKVARTGEAQLRAFANVDLKVIDCLTREWRPAGAGGPTSQSNAELDAAHLLVALDGFGVVPEGTDAHDLGVPSPEEAAAAMQAQGYTPVPRPAPLPEPPAIARFWGIEVPDGPHLDRRKLRSLRDGFYERQEVRAGMACITPEDRLLELGAGSGIVGAAVMQNTKAAAALSFEANPRLLDPARALYARNGLAARMTLEHAILTADPDAPKTLNFGVAPDYLGSRILFGGDVPDPGMEVVSVPTRPFAEVVADWRPTALMMDIEGGELELLERCDLTGFRIIIVELHRGLYGRDGMRRCRAALAKAGLTARADYCRRGVDTWIR